MERGSSQHGPRVDDEMSEESESLERSLKEGHKEAHLDKEGGTGEPGGEGHRIAGSGSSADEYPLKDHGETGGASHPKPKDADQDADKDAEQDD